MTRTRKIAAVVSMGLVFGLAVSAAAQRRAPGLDSLIVMNAKRLGLDKAGVDAVKQVASRFRRQSEQLQREAKPVHASMRVAFERDEPDVSQVMALADQIGALDLAAKKLRLRTAIEMRMLLTPEQRRELSLIQAEVAGTGRTSAGP